MYAKKANGGFRLRASFPITTESVESLNALCAKTGLSIYALCDIAVRRLIADGDVSDAMRPPSRSSKITAGGEA